MGRTLHTSTIIGYWEITTWRYDDRGQQRHLVHICVNGVCGSSPIHTQFMQPKLCMAHSKTTLTHIAVSALAWNQHLFLLRLCGKLMTLSQQMELVFASTMPHLRFSCARRRSFLPVSRAISAAVDFFATVLVGQQCGSSPMRHRSPFVFFGFRLPELLTGVVVLPR